MEVLKINYRNLHTQYDAFDMLGKNISIVDLLVENQTLFGQNCLDNSKDKWFSEFYSRIAIGAVKKIYESNNFLVSQLISMQPMKSPGGIVKYLRFKYGSIENSGDVPQVNLVVEHEDVSAISRHMKLEFPLSKVNPDAATDLKHYQNGYFLTKDFTDKYPDIKEDMEEEMISYVSEIFTNEVSKEVLTDLIKNVGTIATEKQWNNYEEFYVSTIKMSSIIHRKTMRGGGNWIVMSPKMMERIIEGYSYSNLKNRDNDMELFYHGVMNSRWKMYSSKTVIHDNVVMMGYKGESPLDSGYFYNPYIPLSPLEKAPMEEETRIGTLQRYSKKLIREGSKHYARINFGE